MKKFFLTLVFLSAAVMVRAALPEPYLLARLHFAGEQKIFASKEAASFTNEFCSVEARALRAEVADKLSAWLAQWLPKRTGAAAGGGAAKLRPLFDDLQSAEWFFEAHLEPNGKTDAAMAIKLAAARAELWQANLKSFFPFATFKTQGGWLYFDSGTGTERLSGNLEKQASQTNTAWLAADVNWPLLARWELKFKELGLPETQLAVTAASGNLHIAGKLFFPENLSSKLDPWKVPTNTLHQPFVSFTAARGFSSWLKTQSWWQPYSLSPTPNQFFVWALPQIPYQTFAAIPVASAANSLAQAYAKLQPVFSQPDAKDRFLSPFTLQYTNNQITLVGAPFVAPYLQGIREPSGQFLLAGAFPNTPKSQPLPPELFQRLAAKNLVYYHWEITAERLPQALNLSQLSLLLTMHRQLGGESAAMKWIQKVSPKLGNTVTEITQTGPAEMAFTRKGQGAFTALEMLALGNWLESPDFPRWDTKLPPRPKRLQQLNHPPQTSKPAPAK